MNEQIDYEAHAKQLAHAIRALSEALAFNQRVRGASEAEREAVGSDAVAWLLMCADDAVNEAYRLGYPVRIYGGKP